MSQINHDMVNSINWNDIFIYRDGNIYWKTLICKKGGRRKPGPVGTRTKTVTTYSRIKREITIGIKLYG